MARLAGFVLLVNTLLPVLALAGGYWLMSEIWTAVREEAEKPVSLLIADAKALQVTVTQAAEAVEAAIVSIKDDAKDAEEAVTKLGDAIAGINLTFATAKFPTGVKRLCRNRRDRNCCRFRLADADRSLEACLTWRDPLAPAKTAINNAVNNTIAPIKATFVEVDASIASMKQQIAGLQVLGARLRDQAATLGKRAADLQSMLTGARDRLAPLIRTVQTVGLALAAWIVFAILVQASDRLAVGWHMLRTGVRP
ncbi:MAG: hypothetical protein AAGL24_18660 [Pseudomonadota bacterium]